MSKQKHKTAEQTNLAGQRIVESVASSSATSGISICQCGGLIDCAECRAQLKAELVTTSLSEILADYRKQWNEEIEKHSHIIRINHSSTGDDKERAFKESWWKQFKGGK